MNKKADYQELKRLSQKVRYLSYSVNAPRVLHSYCISIQLITVKHPEQSDLNNQMKLSIEQEINDMLIEKDVNLRKDLFYKAIAGCMHDLELFLRD